MYNIGNVGKAASMSMLTLFESRYTLKGRYSICNVGKTASMSMLTLFESRYPLKGRYNIGNIGLFSLNQDIHYTTNFGKLHLMTFHLNYENIVKMHSDFFCQNMIWTWTCLFAKLWPSMSKLDTLRQKWKLRFWFHNVRHIPRIKMTPRWPTEFTVPKLWSVKGCVILKKIQVQVYDIQAVKVTAHFLYC